MFKGEFPKQHSFCLFFSVLEQFKLYLKSKVVDSGVYNYEGDLKKEIRVNV